MPGRCQDPPLERCRGEHFVRVSENGTRKAQERAAAPNKPKTRSEEALHWAINDKLPSPVMHTEDRKAAGAALRAALLDFHRLVKSAQYIKPRDAAPQPPAVN